MKIKKGEIYKNFLDREVQVIDFDNKRVTVERVDDKGGVQYSYSKEVFTRMFILVTPKKAR